MRVMQDGRESHHFTFTITEDDFYKKIEIL